MFEPDTTPRVFAQAPGVDFPRAVVDGLRARMAGQPPEAMARITLFVNTMRMKRRLIALFDEGPALLLPRIRLVTDLGHDAATADLPPAVSPLRRRLELASLISELLKSQPDLAPRHAIYALADSLAALMDEMQGEGVPPSALQDLDVSQHSAYWARSLAFIRLAERFFGAGSDEPPDLEARQRQVIERIAARWAATPPSDPVIVAGSTGSRGATSLLMETVARLPQGALILPGFDRDMPAPVWSGMDDALTAEDHPQYRFRKLLAALELAPDAVPDWHDTAPPAPRRNALISLALRPAPVTDQWQAEGPGFTDVEAATRDLTLIEARSPRAEALAIALILRDAAERGREAALITPDRMLTRQVTAALDRWGILPDDSAGRPLPLTAPGRLLRHVAELRGRRITGVDLLTLLKHPLTHSGAGRNEHLRLTRELELKCLRRGLPFPDRAGLADWAEGHDDRQGWVTWLGDLIADLAEAPEQPLADHVDHLLAVTERLAAGSETEGSGGLWDREAGREAAARIAELRREAEHGGEMNAADFRDLFASILQAGSVRNPDAPYPGIRIWGTLEARVGGADLVILAGLNEGSWPERPAPDPWMNRDMRKNVGLLLPERRIGLSAHDFQQAAGAPEVVLSRALRDDEAETVPSRWINRLTNLMAGMSGEGAAALEAMRARGRRWLEHATELDRPQEARHRAPPAPRPSPQPPVADRPTELSFTQIGTLIRDPYAIYADKILRLRPLDPLHQSPDAPLRGTAIHAVMDRFMRERPEVEDRPAARDRLLSVAQEVFQDQAPWPATRLLWRAKLERVADWFLDGEDERQKTVRRTFTEVNGRAVFGDGFTLKGTADRIDLLDDGRIAIYDYKTGTPPSRNQQLAYDKQLLLEALVAEAGGFPPLAPIQTARVAYIGLGASPKLAEVDIADETLGRIRAELETILAEFSLRSRGYTSRRVVLSANARFGGDFDHLARFGEWDHTAEPVALEVGE